MSHSSKRALKNEPMQANLDIAITIHVANLFNFNFLHYYIQTNLFAHIRVCVAPVSRNPLIERDNDIRKPHKHFSV